MPWPVHPTGFLGARGDSDTYRIERSLRFNSADSAYLARTFSSAGNRRTWTWSGWVKRSALSSGALFGADGSNYMFIYFESDTIDCGEVVTSQQWRRRTSQLFRDPSAWYHVIISFDSTQSTAGNRVKVYINGSQITSFSLSADPSLNYDSVVNTAISHSIGSFAAPTRQQYLNGYLTEIYFIDGQTLTPSSFGQTDPITGRWVAKEYNGTYGTNGFYLKFADNSGTTATTLGKDSSGNGNNWTPNNFSVTAGAGNDSLVDSPTNYGTDSYSTSVDNARGNYCTFNPIEASGLSATYSDGNLQLSGSTYGATNYTNTISVNSGKWYFEYSYSAIGSSGVFGGVREINGGSKQVSYRNNGQKIIDGTASTYGSSYTTSDIIGCAVDVDNGITEFFKNGTTQGTVSNSFSGRYLTIGQFGAISTFGSDTVRVNFGQRPFAYAAPAGYKALCTTNLTIPTINKPNKYMDALAYTGTGASNAISSLNFSPDLVWIKNRGTTTDHALYDIVRGAQAQLSSNTTGTEVTSSTGLTSFDGAGFTLGTSSLVNTNGTQYVAWSWDAGGTTSTNTSGSITSTVRANTQAGFSIVSYTGTGANSTVGHGLGVAPKMVIAKGRSQADNWLVWHTGLTGTTYYVSLNGTGAQATATTPWGGSFSSTNFSITSVISSNLTTYIAYCFAEIEGYSKFGSYTGNGSADGPFVWCGFRPRWVIYKRIDASGGWVLLDTARDNYNPIVNLIRADTSAADTTGGVVNTDGLCNGFKLRTINTDMNATNGTYIFAAFAETPFKYARAR